MATTFKFMGADVEVEDGAFAKKIEDIVAGESYTLSALEKVAPNLMRAIHNEQRTLTDRRLVASKFTVQAGWVKSEVDGKDTRFQHKGTRIGG